MSFGRLTLVLLIATGLFGCGPVPPSTPFEGPVVLICVDTLRADHLPAYGYKGVATPAIDCLARESVVFERVFSHVPLTLPSHSALFTGLIPPENGVRNNRGFHLPPSRRTLAEAARDKGFRTAGFVSSMVLGHETGISQGFEFYEDGMKPAPRPQGQNVFSQRKGAVTAGAAAAWLDKGGPEKFFMFLHLYDPHSPYDPPEPFASRYALAYDGEIAYTDQVIGGFLDHLRAKGLYDKALIVLFSDHGEGLGDHGESEHGLLLYREELEVPLMIKLPGGELAGSRRRGPFALTDLTATLTERLGLSLPAATGHSLFSSPQENTKRTIYAETLAPRHAYGWSELRSIIRWPFQFIEAPVPELYDNAQDPRQLKNLVPGLSAPVEMVETLAGIPKGNLEEGEVSGEDEERLVALGYVGGAKVAPDVTLPNPRDKIHLAEALWAAVRKVGKTGDLEPERTILALMPELSLQNQSLFRIVARNMLAGGAPESAWKVLEPFADSMETGTQVMLGEAAAGCGRTAEASLHFRRALALDPEAPRAHLGLALLALREGKPRAAEEPLKRALDLDPNLAEGWNAEGVIQAQCGLFQGAIRSWRRAVDLDPDLYDAWFNLAVTLRNTGNHQGAIDALRRYLTLAKGGDRARAQGMLHQWGE